MGHQYYTTLLATFFHIALTTNRDAKELLLLLRFLTNCKSGYNSPLLLRAKDSSTLENTLLVKNSRVSKGISAQASYRTVPEPLNSYGSYYPSCFYYQLPMIKQPGISDGRFVE